MQYPVQPPPLHVEGGAEGAGAPAPLLLDAQSALLSASAQVIFFFFFL